MRALDLVGLGERQGAGMPRVEMLHELVVGAAFAGNVEDHALVLPLDPAVQLFAGAYVFAEQPGVGHQPRASVNIPTHSRL